MKLPPCKECKTRSAGCHVACPKYIEWKMYISKIHRLKREAEAGVYKGRNV